MKTLILEEPQVFKFIEQEQPTRLEPHEALIKIKNIGICGTDYHAFRGKQPFFSYPRVLGHELGAEVVAVGQENDRIKIGDKVTVEPYMNCGNCQPCSNGKGNCCENLQVLGVHTDGGMCEFIKVPMHKLHASKSLTFEQLAVVEPLSIGAHAVQRAAVSAEDLVLVIGAGPIGLSVIQFAKLSGATVAVLDINTERLDFAKEHLQADILLDGSKGFTSEEFRAELGQKLEILNHSSNKDNKKTEGLTTKKSPTGGFRGLEGSKGLEGFSGLELSVLPTIVFDATGNPNSMKNAFNFVAFGGKLVFVGLYIGDVVFDDPLFHRREMTLFASRNSHGQDFTNIIQLMEEGKIDVNKWITHRAKFDDLPSVYEHWLNPETKVIKAMVSL
ncbi:zinc-binding alcohol dehydrogenase family protein [Lacihabitans soyangensis]|uniref:zinc-binding alcohol dehydrogenase family protein n=1 Tax=Lacihabitans soyangensis TaxID=869394 RepID=UPI0020CD3BC6|nr:zinc-binding alcohol dehydrogenase family protein [Lacihabitans soyangensis]